MGETRVKFDRILLVAFLLRRETWSGSSNFYLRIARNIAAGEVAMSADEDLAERDARNGLTRANAHAQWREVRHLIPHLDWGRIRAQRPRMDLT